MFGRRELIRAQKDPGKRSLEETSSMHKSRHGGRDGEEIGLIEEFVSALLRF